MILACHLKRCGDILDIEPLIIAIQLAIHVLTSAQPHTLTYYGTEGDGYLGQPPGAYWHGHDCTPDVVDEVFFGAAAPRDVPYCTRLLVCYDRCAEVVVVDRQAHDVILGLPHVDLWPAPARHLGMVEEGIVVGWVWALEEPCPFN